MKTRNARHPPPPRDPEPTTPGDRLRPWLLGAMMMLVVARPLVASESAARFGDGLPMVMLWLALAVFWLLGVVGRRETKGTGTSPRSEPAPFFPVRFGWTDAAVLALVAWHTLAAVWVTGHGQPRPAVNMLWEWIGYGVAFFLARQLIVTRREGRAAMAVMIALAVALAAHGLYQVAYEMPQTELRYQADPDGEMQAAGFWFPPGSSERRLFEDRLANREPTATFALTNSLAAVLATWLVVLGGAGMTGLSRKRLWVCAAPLAACLAMTKSRSALVAVAVGLLLLWLLARRRPRPLGWKPLAAVGAAALLLAGLAASGLGGPLADKAAKSFGYRLQYWQSAGRMIVEHPLLGCGPGNFQAEYMRYKLPDAGEEVADPHNFLVEVSATAGVPATLALVVALVMFFLRRSRLSSERDGNSPVLTILAGGLAGFLLSVPLGLLSTAPPGAAAVLLGLPVAVLVLAALWPWVSGDNGELPPWLPAVAVAALLVDLSASGGIGIPGVAGSLWLLLAMGLCGDEPRHLPHAAALGLVALVVAAAVACYATGYSPVLRCRGATNLAKQAEDPAAAEKHLRTAADADPLACEPHRQLAAIALERWRQSGDDRQFAAFAAETQAALDRAPNLAPAWLAAGDGYLERFFKTKRPADVDPALDAYRRAAALYPNSGLIRAKLAVACWLGGRDADARQEAAAALRLDAATPHENMKLPPELRGQLRQLAPP